MPRFAKAGIAPDIVHLWKHDKQWFLSGEIIWGQGHLPAPEIEAESKGD